MMVVMAVPIIDRHVDNGDTSVSIAALAGPRNDDDDYDDDFEGAVHACIANALQRNWLWNLGEIAGDPFAAVEILRRPERAGPTPPAGILLNFFQSATSRIETLREKSLLQRLYNEFLIIDSADRHSFAPKKLVSALLLFAHFC